MKKIFFEKKKFSTAVLLVAFNRPDTTRAVFAAIQRAKPPRLYIAADGPRKNFQTDIELIAKVKEIVTSVNWPCKVKTLFRKKNIGCGPGVKTAIDWFFKYEKKGIILEDDTVPTKDFFFFCEELLTRYFNEKRIAMISGTNHTKYKPKKYSYCFSKNKDCWGWATWKHSWSNIDYSMKWRNDLQAKDILKNMYSTYLSENHWKSCINHIDNNLVSSWAWPWSFSISSQNQLCIVPSSNLVKNIGQGDFATHTKKLFPIHDKTKGLNFPLKHPKYVCPNYEYDLLFEQYTLQTRGIKKIIPISIKNFIKKFFI